MSLVVKKKKKSAINDYIELTLEVEKGSHSPASTHPGFLLAFALKLSLILGNCEQSAQHNTWVDVDQ